MTGPSFIDFINEQSEGLSNPVDFIQYNTGYTPTGSEPVGTRYWDQTKMTTSLVLPYGSVLQDGQEFQTPIYNDTGVKLLNGQTVRLSGLEATIDKAVLASASDEQNAYAVIGIMTTDAEIDGYGTAVRIGELNGVDTSAYAPNTCIWLSDTPGEWTDTIPDPPSMPVRLGYVKVQDATVGSLSVRVDVEPALRAVQVAKDPTGFFEPEDCIVTYDSTARTITLTGTVQAYWKGQYIPVLTTGWVSEAHDATAGVWYLYYDGADFIWSQTPWSFEKLQIAYAYYNGIKFGLRECHGTLNWPSHEEFHNVIGTWRESGGTLSGYTLSSTTAAERRPLISAAVIHDEDLETTNAALATESYSLNYLTSTDTNNILTAQADIVPLLGNNPYWNEFTGGAWQQTLMSNNTYMNVWVLAIPTTADATSQSLRYVFIQGQENGSLVDMQNVQPQDVNLGELGLALPEFVFMTKIIIRYTAANWRITSVTNLTGNKFIQTGAPSGTFLSVVSHDTTLTGSGTVADPLGINLADDFTWTGDHTFNGTTTTINSTTTTVDNMDITDDLTVDTNTLHVDSTNDRVGVGTTSPAYELDVTGAMHSTMGRVITDRVHGNGKTEASIYSDISSYFDGINKKLLVAGYIEERTVRGLTISFAERMTSTLIRFYGYSGGGSVATMDIEETGTGVFDLTIAF